MEKRKLQKKGYIGKSLVTYFRLLDLLKVILDMLDNGYAGYPAMFWLFNPTTYCKGNLSVRLEREW